MPTLLVVYPSFDLVVQMQRKAGRPFNQVMLLNTTVYVPVFVLLNHTKKLLFIMVKISKKKKKTLSLKQNLVTVAQIHLVRMSSRFSSKCNYV